MWRVMFIATYWGRDGAGITSQIVDFETRDLAEDGIKAFNEDWKNGPVSIYYRRLYI